MKGLRKKNVCHPILCEYIGGSSIEDNFLFFIWLSNASIQQREKEKGTTRGRDLPTISILWDKKHSVKCMIWGINPEILKIRVHLAI